MARLRARGKKRSRTQAEDIQALVQTIKQRGLKNTDLRVTKDKCDWFGLHLVVRCKGKRAVRGQEIVLNWHEMMELSNGKVYGVSATAAARHISRRTARRVVELCAYAEVEWQGQQCQDLERLLSQHEGNFFAGTRLAWDETCECLQLDAAAGLVNAEQKASSWTVLVMHLTLFWGCDRCAGFHEVVLPPCPSSATSPTTSGTRWSAIL